MVQGLLGCSHAALGVVLSLGLPGPLPAVQRPRAGCRVARPALSDQSDWSSGLGEPPSGGTYVAHLHRFAVKGLERDELARVSLQTGGTFPHDREWALRWADAPERFDASAPSWMHKSNFLCAFTANELLGGLDTHFDDGSSSLSVVRRATGEALLTRADLSTAAGRAAAAAFFSRLAGREVEVVTGGVTHQFGNTGSGVKASGDARTIHIVNSNTVAAVASAIGRPLHPERFRPNVILAGSLPAWEEFSWVGQMVSIGAAALTIIKRTVRCKGVNVDARRGAASADLDLPDLLARHFPQHGPYLGVYAQVARGGDVSVGDHVQVL